MANPITSKAHFEKCLFNQCCFFFTLRAGSLIIGCTQLILGILWLIGGVSEAGGGYTAFISTVLMIAAGVFTLIGIKKDSAKFLWYSVYINIILGIWMILFAIILFATLLWGMAIGSIINCLLIFYFAAILRSYSFELEAGPANPTNPA